MKVDEEVHTGFHDGDKHMQVYRFYKAVVNSEMIFTKMKELCSLALRRVMSVEMNTVPSVGR